MGRELVRTPRRKFFLPGKKSTNRMKRTLILTLLLALFVAASVIYTNLNPDSARQAAEQAPLPSVEGPTLFTVTASSEGTAVSASSEGTTESATPSPETGEATEKPAIRIDTPLTVGTAAFSTRSGERRMLRIRLTSGTLYEDWFAGGWMGQNASGSFIAEVSDDAGNVLATTSIDDFFDEPLTFIMPFDVTADDWNGDGRTDFALGMPIGSNGGIYRLLTIEEDGRVVRLAADIDGSPDILLYPEAGNRFSPGFLRDGAELVWHAYSQEKGTLEGRMTWHDDSFSGTVKTANQP